MSLDPPVLEMVRRLCQAGEEPELVRENEWEYVFRTGAKSYITISKFQVHDTFKVDISSFPERWATMGRSDRIRFASNFWNKSEWEDGDNKILETIRQDGDDGIWQCCTLAFLKHPDREMAITFLLSRLRSTQDPKPLNYIQALGLAKDHRAIPVLRSFYETYRSALQAEIQFGIPDDVFFGPIPYHAYFVVCGALLAIATSSEYEGAIREYLDHPNEQVRYWAEHALGIEGPTTRQRKAEFLKSFRPGDS